MINSLGLIQQATAMEENMSNLTSASGEASVSSNNNRNENSGISQQPPKKKRSQPGHPEPGAEVIALSPRTLMATNRFVCDVCNKGFQRDQNLQLHRRGHNLPWKLKQKSNKEVGRKVYICPEIGCVHHDPSRALGDLTGIKKHFFRKHGEKKYKCEKCSKKYAVQSDWKAHSKICGTREYRCDCGTLFSRRDSFITHRAFCDALAQENVRSMSRGNGVVSMQYGQNCVDNANNGAFQIKREQQNLILKQEIPPWLSCSPIIGASLGPPPPPPPPIDLTTTPSLILQDFPQNHHHHLHNPNPNPSCSSLGPTSLPPPYHHLLHHPPPPPPPHISATALLQKASQMGANSTTQQFPFPDHVTTGHSISTTAYNFGPASREQQQLAAAHEMMVMNNNGLGFDDMEFGQMLNQNPSSKDDEDGSRSFHANVGQFSGRSGMEGENLTRDFLGLRPLSQNDILSITSCINGNENEEEQTPKSWQN